MRIPRAAPSYREAVGHLAQYDAESLVTILEAADLAPGERYRHYDRLRYYRPPEGVSIADWWAGIKLKRYHARHEVALHAQTGAPFWYTLPEVLLEKLYRVEQCLRTALTEADAASVRELEEEAIRSSQLEGAGTTRQEAELLLRTQRQPRNTSERMVYNNYRALLQAKAMADRLLTVDALHDLHQTVTEGTIPPEAPPIAVRDDSRYPIYVADTDGTVLYVPPKSDALPDRLAALVAFANAQNPAMHPVIKAIVLHFALAYDHPYIDGNGRAARALFYWAMIRAGYQTVEYLSISSVLRVHKARYLRSFLYAEQDEGDLTYFVLAQLDVILEAYDKLTEAIAYKRQQLDTWAAPDLNARQKALMADVSARAHVSITIQDHQRTHGVSYPTARDDLLGLVDKGYLTQVRVGKKFVFMQKE